MRERWSVANEEWVNEMETFFTYENENVILTLNKTYNPQTGVWTNHSKTTNEYYPVENYKYTLYETWIENQWIESTKQIDSLNAAGYVTDAARFHNIDNEWIPTSHFKYVYQSDTLLIEEWMQNLADLTYDSKTEHYYNETGGRDSTKSYYLLSGEWNLYSFMHYEYTPFNKIAGYVYWLWDLTYQTWYLYNESTSFYDNDQILVERHYFNYNIENEVINARRYFYSANPDGTLHQSIIKKSVDDEWVNDLRQTYTYPVASAISEKAPGNLILYPNPAQTEIRFLTDEMGSRGSYRIINATGKTVMNGSFSESNNPINIRELPSGFYLIEIRTHDKTAISRFVKN